VQRRSQTLCPRGFTSSRADPQRRRSINHSANTRGVHPSPGR
jgi:hypothetical protein